MEPIHLQQHNILYSCEVQKKRGHEQLVVEHALGIIQAGEAHFQTTSGMEIVKEGMIGMVRKNLLAKTVKVPPADGRPFKSINIFLDQSTLQKYSAEHGLRAATPYRGSALVDLSNDPFLKSYFDSLAPYFDQPDQLTASLAALKTKEAIELILRNRPHLKDFLFDFTEPFKIDLEAFMNQHFTYHVPIVQFARLTGRSLATFKRDFQKVFSASPEKWLLRKRLEQAHFLIRQQQQKPTEVYAEVGFENLSHFSNAFRNYFGYTASSLLKQVAR